jgi:RNA polymerase sigma-70 factor (ECF subfamily)
MKHYGNAETRRAIRALLDRLPGRYGDVLEWKYVEGRSVEEIASMLGIGRIAAQSMLARARASFRDAIEVAFGATEDDVLSHLRGRS